MKTLPILPGQAASSRPSPVEIWQILLFRLLDQHYGFILNDTPFTDEHVIEQYIEAGISLCNAVNLLVEKYAPMRTDQLGSSAYIRSQLINSIGTLRTHRATGLIAHDNYKAVNSTTLGKCSGAK